MSEIATYSFLPWLRQGIANRIEQVEGDTNIQLRASVNVGLTLEGKKGENTLSRNVERDVSLFGPGDIIGIESKAIIKNEPRNWITNFESNYLPYIDFYDEDFPWRYTPAAPNLPLHRLRPWLALVVLKEEEFKDGQNIQGRPLPFIEVADVAATFPPQADLWAWAHVHVNQKVTPNGDPDRVNSGNTSHILNRVNSILNQNPDLGHARLISPRKLEPQTAYHAFLIPSFEAGRLAGLGLDLQANPFASFPAWGEAYPSGTQVEPSNFPVYHRWYFRTGELGDFEYLVRLLEPKPVDSRVGSRPIDVQEPGSNLPGITDPELGGVLRLGGALQIPEATLSDEDLLERQTYENWDQSYPHPFQDSLASLLNLPDDYTTEGDPDPLIAPPIYGQWHALVKRLLKEKDDSPAPNRENWMHELNLDPRHRTTANFGTQVIQDNQEAYMDAAWSQVGEVIAANRRIRLAILSLGTSTSWYRKQILPLLNQNQLQTLLHWTAPMQARIMSNQETAQYAVQRSTIPRALISAPMRRVLRPGSRLMRKLPFTAEIEAGNLIDRVNEESVHVAPPYTMPETLPQPEDAADAIEPPGFGEKLFDLFAKVKWLGWVLLALGVLLAILIALLSLGAGVERVLGIIAGISLILGILILRGKKQAQGIDSIREENQRPETVDLIPKSPDFRIVQIGEEFTPKQGLTDSDEGKRFKIALRDVFSLVHTSKTVSVAPVREALQLSPFTQNIVATINPTVTIPKFVYSGIRIPFRIVDQMEDEIFQEAMAYPVFDIPMYKPLVEKSDELFLPNIQLIAENSISLLETNQPFIEAYMVGLNHEFARELLWREYPTDQRGSYFRQFWDVSSFLDRNNTDEETLKEQLRDIPPLHLWSKTSQLGDHDHREKPGEKENEVVLVIRGELLKKYPTAVIYAQKAIWAETEGEFDPKKERQLVPLTPAELDNPPEDKLLTPIYECKVDPDIYFFGFDLNTVEALGDNGDNPTADNAGWFFIIKERPGEPRFGLDIEGDPIASNELQVWNDLAWTHVQNSDSFLSTNQTFSITGTTPAGEDVEKAPQWEDDQHIQWTPNTNAADLAYILYQVPVMVAVHTSEMLPKNN